MPCANHYNNSTGDADNNNLSDCTPSVTFRTDKVSHFTGTWSTLLLRWLARRCTLFVSVAAIWMLAAFWRLLQFFNMFVRDFLTFVNFVTRIKCCSHAHIYPFDAHVWNGPSSSAEQITHFSLFIDISDALSNEIEILQSHQWHIRHFHIVLVLSETRRSHLVLDKSFCLFISARKAACVF